MEKGLNQIFTISKIVDRKIEFFSSSDHSKFYKEVNCGIHGRVVENVLPSYLCLAKDTESQEIKITANKTFSYAKKDFENDSSVKEMDYQEEKIILGIAKTEVLNGIHMLKKSILVSLDSSDDMSDSGAESSNCNDETQEAELQEEEAREENCKTKLRRK